MIDQHPKPNHRETFERISNQSKLLNIQNASKRAVEEATAAVRRGDIHREDPIMDSHIQLLDILLEQTGPHAPYHNPEQEAEDIREISEIATDLYTNVWVAVQEGRLSEDNPLAVAAVELRKAVYPESQDQPEQAQEGPAQ